MAVIILPRSAIKELNDDHVTIEIPDEKLLISYANLEIVRATRGLLRSKKKKLLHYLEQSRAEWDRE